MDLLSAGGWAVLMTALAFVAIVAALAGMGLAVILEHRGQLE